MRAIDRSGARGDTVPLLLVSGVVVAVAAGFGRGVWLPNLHNGVLALAFVLVGAYVLHQQPRNRCGRAFLAAGVVEAVMFLGRQIGHDPAPGTSAWWGWLGVWPVVVGLALGTLSVVLFPDGSLPSPAWRWVIRVGAVLTAALAATAALWPVGEAAVGVVTPHPFTIAGAETATDLWTVAARPTYALFQILWLVAVFARWRTSGRAARRQLTVVGAAVVVSLVALATGLVLWSTPTVGVLAACLVPIAAGWAIVHGQTLATYSALTWLARRSDNDAALPSELAAAIADALAAQHVLVSARRNGRYHAVGMWPEPADLIVPVNDLDPLVLTADRTTERVRVIVRGDIELGVVVVDRQIPLSRHDERLLDGFCGQAVLVLEHLAACSAATGGGPSRQLDRLTPRELEVLDLMAKGLTNAAICEHLHLSIKTVEPAVSSIFTKLGLPPGPESNRRVLAVLAYVDNQRTTSLDA
jgi:DNA-binding CsgD family transcriptional regulator